MEEFDRLCTRLTNFNVSQVPKYCLLGIHSNEAMLAQNIKNTYQSIGLFFLVSASEIAGISIPIIVDSNYMKESIQI